MTTSIQRLRESAFNRQDGRCYYCGEHMWLDDGAAFAAQHQMTGRQARQRRCTAEHLVARHPFPGPGLAVRCLGEVTEEKLALLREADAIFLEELRASGWYERTSQAFAVFLPVKSVGVMGDFRTYEHVVALRSVDTRDFMTADWSPLPHELLGRVANRIVNEVRGLNRVVYDVTSKPPGTIEWE